MDRELLLLVVALAASGPWLLWTGRRGTDDTAVPSARDLERRRWRALWRPFVPLAFVAALLAGWALQEPAAAEQPSRWLAVLAVPGAALAFRAAIRAVRSLSLPPAEHATGTVGVLRPAVRIAPALQARLDGPALAAVNAHEAAHVRHRDPLRIWLARLATDLQAGTAAKSRLSAWLTALELARDEEARDHGASGIALGEAILAAARLPRVGAAVAGPDADLSERIERLLQPVPAQAADHAKAWWVALLPLAALGGVAYGEPLLRWMLW